MTRGRHHGTVKPPSAEGTAKAKAPSDKDRHRAAVHGRRAQTMGSGGRSGGTKASGGRVKGGARRRSAGGGGREGAARR